MGAIQRLDSEPQRLEYLYHRHNVGRAPDCRLTIAREAVSSHHAAIYWTDGRWHLRDLNSRNGTFLNGRRLDADPTGALLSEGDVIGFAERDELWELVDASRPCSRLIPLGDEGTTVVLDSSDIVLLPSNEQPRAAIYQADGTWQLEREGEVRALADGEELTIDGRRYRLMANDVELPTAEAETTIVERKLVNLHLELQVSPDEESAALRVELAAQVHELQRQTHLYLLVLLARQRIAETAEHGADAGWLDVASAVRELQLSSPEVLAVHVFRCRKSIEACGVEDSGKIIDRSKRGFLRIGLPASRLKLSSLR